MSEETAVTMMYLSLHIALSCLILSISTASEAVLPTTRGGATAVSKYIDDKIEDHHQYAIPQSEVEISRETEEVKIRNPRKNSNRTKASSRSGLTSRIIKKRSKKNNVAQSSEINSDLLADQSIGTETESQIETEIATTLASTTAVTTTEIVTELAVEQFIEPMCRPADDRFALFPIRNHRMWEMYKKHVASFWTVRNKIKIMITNTKN